MTRQKHTFYAHNCNLLLQYYSLTYAYTFNFVVNCWTKSCKLHWLCNIYGMPVVDHHSNCFIKVSPLFA